MAVSFGPHITIDGGGTRSGLNGRMAREQPRFTRRLSQIPDATFNPFLDYY